MCLVLMRDEKKGRKKQAMSNKHMYTSMNKHVLMRDERRKEERSKQDQTNKAKQHSTPKAVTFHKKNELPQVGLEPTTCTCTSLGQTNTCTSMNKHVLMRDERRKKEASKIKQTRQSNTAHPRQSLFLRKMS